MHDRTTHGTLFTLSEYSRFRATSCALRSTINPHTERNKVRWFLRVFFQITHYQPSRALFISCNKLHATIHDQITHGTKQSVVIFPCIFSDKVLSTVTNVIHFVCSVQLVARTNHTRNEIKCGDFSVCFFKQRIINRQERYSFRATSCTLQGLFLI